MYSAGDCILFETDQYKDGTSKAHLFVVILDAEKDDDVTLIIPMNTIPDRGFYDTTTEISVNEHEFVKQPTYMNYNLSMIIYKGGLDRLIARKEARRKDPPVSRDLLKKISSGISKSDHAPSDVQEVYLFSLL